MTLLELLRQELPKRGGWPEGADVISTNGYGHVWSYKSKECISGTELGIYSSEEGYVTREQYEATGWDGTGLPPVGCECEYSRPPVEADSFGSAWERCFIRYVSFRIVVIQTHDDELSGHPSKFNFRPLRTEAERAIDEMVRLSGVSTGAARILYDAGYRKE